MKDITIAIVGLGLIGGSIAKAAQIKLGISSILASDTNPSAIREAISEGIVSEPLTFDNASSADFLFICTPVSSVSEEVKKWVSHIKHDCIITDIGSTKSGVISSIEALPHDFSFVGGHPMTGSEKSGYSASKSHLFENAYYLLTKTSKSTEESIKQMHKFVSDIGAIPMVIDAAAHDSVMAAISHLPHIAACGLVNMLSASDKPAVARQLAAGGFRDITRIASSSPVMWENICTSNTAPIIGALDEYINVLSKMREELCACNSESIFDYFSNAKALRDSMDINIRSDSEPHFEIMVDVEDTPGVIGQVATVLGLSRVNIKNMMIANSREFENGVLIVTLSTRAEQDKAYEILKQFNFGVEYKL